jgi:hypothetical protein
VVCECPLISSRRKAILGSTTLWDIQQVLNDGKQLIQAVTLVADSGLAWTAGYSIGTSYYEEQQGISFHVL